VTLHWPKEYAGFDIAALHDWHHAGSNLCLDFHGDPQRADWVVFSDGNHHMALEESLQTFVKQHAPDDEVFYATTPPGPIVNILQTGGLLLGNLKITIKPQLFISPPAVLEKLQQQGLVGEIHPFMRNNGSVLLVKKGNPKKINGVDALTNREVRLFISNAEKEKVSYDGYAQTLQNLGIGDISKLNMVYGERIHHREAPQSIADDRADAAIVFYHLALRYIRIFPERFEIVPLGGTAEEPRPLAGNVIADTALAMVRGEETHGEKLLTFMQSEIVTKIYQRHGLRRITG